MIERNRESEAFLRGIKPKKTGEVGSMPHYFEGPGMGRGSVRAEEKNQKSG